MLQGNAKLYPILKQRYNDYVKLYKFVNNGSTQGICSFADFYWRFNYNIKYSEPKVVSSTNM